MHREDSEWREAEAGEAELSVQLANGLLRQKGAWAKQKLVSGFPDCMSLVFYLGI